MPRGQERIVGWAFDRAQRGFMRGDALAAERRGERLGLLAYRLDKKHRNRAEANLRLAFPERDDAWIVATARESFLHFGRLAGDLMRSPARTDEEVLSHLELPPGALDYLEPGRGTVVCTGHFGNWERAAHWVTASGHKLSVVVRHANQAIIQDRLEKLRKSAGIDLLSRGDAAMGMMRKLRRGEMVAVLPDQNASDAFVPFFGHKTGTVIGPAVMARRTEAFMLPAFCLRTGPGQYRMLVHAPLDFRTNPVDPVEAMALYYQALEAAVREAPEQYLWMHDRWKSSRRRKML